MHSLAPWDPFRYVAAELESLVKDLAQPSALAPGTRVLDFGCATQPYRDLFGPGVDYVGADLPGNPEAHIELRDDGTVPLPDSSFDMVLSTQVLEHVVDPARYLAECHRLLKPGGSMVLSTHGIMYYHPDPEDYWRWTSAGLVKVVEQAGLEVARIRGVLGLAAASLQLMQWATLGHLPGRARRPYTMLLQRLIAAADRRHSDVSRVHNCMVLGVRAVKPGGPSVPEERPCGNE
ncbi:MAG TPA: methyltransferase domain-containing protein [Acidimicrobiales bacterium]|nr:methyltransferase domain-containing protein [Acidimicrobiales bacterium]